MEKKLGGARVGAMPTNQMPKYHQIFSITPHLNLIFYIMQTSYNSELPPDTCSCFSHFHGHWPPQ